MGRAFASGHLYLPVAPQPELLALANPQDNRFNGPFKLLDTVLYRDRYYLYHGATPAVLLFAPWFLVTRHDLPENFAAFLLALGAYVFLSRLFLDVLRFASIQVSIPMLVLCLLALGIGQSVPFLLHRAIVYEIAIACGFCCTSGGFYFLFRCLSTAGARALWGGLSGLCFGLAIGARPHLGLAAAVGFILLALFRKRDLVAFAVPVIACVAAIAAYNFARFGNPLEFGLRYQLADTPYQNIHVSSAHEGRGLYYLLLSPPDLVPEFPFVRLAWRDPVPENYFYEPTAGIVEVSSVAGLAILLPFFRRRLRREVFAFLIAVSLFAAGCLVFIAATGLTSQRFEVDFAPFLLLVGCTVAAALLQGPRIGAKTLVTVAVSLVFLWTIGANIALGLQGPYDQFIQASPDEFVKLARWFSPVERFRLVENPALRAYASFDFSKPCTKGRWPLIATGEFGSRYLLSETCDPQGNLQLLSETSVGSNERRVAEVPYAAGFNLVGIAFAPKDRIMTVSWNGSVVLRQRLRFLVTAPSQIHFGWDPTWGNQIVYPGKMAVYEAKMSTH